MRIHRIVVKSVEKILQEYGYITKTEAWLSKTLTSPEDFKSNVAIAFLGSDSPRITHTPEFPTRVDVIGIYAKDLPEPLFHTLLFGKDADEIALRTILVEVEHKHSIEKAIKRIRAFPAGAKVIVWTQGRDRGVIEGIPLLPVSIESFDTPRIKGLTEVLQNHVNRIRSVVGSKAPSSPKKEEVPETKRSAKEAKAATKELEGVGKPPVEVKVGDIVQVTWSEHPQVVVGREDNIVYLWDDWEKKRDVCSIRDIIGKIEPYPGLRGSLEWQAYQLDVPKILREHGFVSSPEAPLELTDEQMKKLRNRFLFELLLSGVREAKKYLPVFEAEKDALRKMPFERAEARVKELAKDAIEAYRTALELGRRRTPRYARRERAPPEEVTRVIWASTEEAEGRCPICDRVMDKMVYFWLPQAPNLCYRFKRDSRRLYYCPYCKTYFVWDERRKSHIEMTLSDIIRKRWAEFVGKEEPMSLTEQVVNMAGAGWGADTIAEWLKMDKEEVLRIIEDYYEGRLPEVTGYTLPPYWLNYFEEKKRKKRKKGG